MYKKVANANILLTDDNKCVENYMEGNLSKTEEIENKFATVEKIEQMQFNKVSSTNRTAKIKELDEITKLNLTSKERDKHFIPSKTHATQKSGSETIVKRKQLDSIIKQVNKMSIGYNEKLRILKGAFSSAARLENNSRFKKLLKNIIKEQLKTCSDDEDTCIREFQKVLTLPYNHPKFVYMKDKKLRQSICSLSSKELSAEQKELGHSKLNH